MFLEFLSMVTRSVAGSCEQMVETFRNLSEMEGLKPARLVKSFSYLLEVCCGQMFPTLSGRWNVLSWDETACITDAEAADSCPAGGGDRAFDGAALQLETDRMIRPANACDHQRVYGVGMSYFFKEPSRHTLSITRKAQLLGQDRGTEQLRKTPLNAVGDALCWPTRSRRRGAKLWRN